jgi:hypothetical protein
MRTVFVNPTSRKKTRRKAKRRRSRPVAKARPVRRRKSSRRRRRNSGIAPFVQNPGLRVNPLRVNPRRRRKARRNPEFKLKPMLMNLGMMLAGSGTGAGINLLALRRIENVWFRNGLRFALAAASSAGLQNTFGGATAGAIMYPSYAELALTLDLLGEGTTTEADLEELSADLEDVMEEIDVDYDDEDDIF